MKKLLALVLALIMVLGLGVTAFADTINVIQLRKEIEEDDELDPIELLPNGTVTDVNTNESTYLVFEGGDYYIPIVKTGLKNIEVSATGNVTAEIVEFDGETMEYKDETIKYYVVCDDTKNADGSLILYNMDAMKAVLTAAGMDPTEITSDCFATYKDADKVADKLNKAVKKPGKYYAAAWDVIENKQADKDFLKITVADNYTAAYKEGNVKITAKLGKDTVVANLTIISDVIIFEYDEFNWAVEEGEALQLGAPGYSDYATYKLGYSTGIDYDADALRMDGTHATVVSTTEFRAAEGEDLTIAADFDANGDPKNYIEIKEIAKGQKGVNFYFEDYKYYDEDDEKLATGKLNGTNWNTVKGNVEYVTFGFLGNQVINSDFTITVAPQITYYQLRELFGKKVEEEDIITYYVLKDGVKIDEFTVDYANDDIDEDVELEILGKAGDKLGFYTLTLDAPAAEEGEENPNTGAESVVGVVAAMAVISLATAAAVSLKK